MKKPILITLCSLLFVFGLAGCEQDQGPAEEAGENIDQAMDNIKSDLNDAGETASDTAEDLGNEVEDACEDVKEGMSMEETNC